MKKVFLFAACATMMFAACSSDDSLSADQSQVAKLEKNAVGFDVYTQRSTTRAGWAGSVRTADLKSTSTDLGKAGFGVFAFYTDNNEYEQRSIPNFMYNQQVKWDGSSAFSYEPIVYWPNEYGDNAISDDADKLTFFAYAPYVKVTPTSGKVTADGGTGADDAAKIKYNESFGITGMTKNNTAGDPILKYIGSFDHRKSVDLCWGVCDQNDGAAWDITKTGNVQTSPALPNGLPWINVERPAGVDQKVRFTFKHATAQLRVSIDAIVDEIRHATGAVDGKTRIWVRQITFKGFTMKGALNLNNADANKPLWLDYNGQNEIVTEDVVVLDGRKDGKEGVAGAVATNEKVLGLNPTLIQDGVYEDIATTPVVHGVDAAGNKKSETDWDRKGVTATTVNLFKTTDDNKSDNATFVGSNAFFHVIPGTDKFEVEIVYDVETIDGNLALNLSDGKTKGSSIENRISKEITFGTENTLKPGHSYTLALHLGMNSVKYDAAVTDWVEEAAQDVDLPLNTPVFAANTTNSGTGSSSTPYEVTIPYTGNYTFAITGLHGQESMTSTAGNNTTTTTDAAETESAGTLAGWTADAGTAWTNGTYLQVLEISKANPSTCDRIQKWSWKGNQSNFDTYFAFTQKAHPLYMKITAGAKDQNTITLTRYNNVDASSSTDWTHEYGWFCGINGVALTANVETEGTADNHIHVWRNGTKLTYQPSAGPTGDKFTFANKGESDKYTAKITIGDNLKAGDVIKVELKTGDAPVEVATWVVPE